ncbi:BRO family protein [Bacillus sp. ISL-77]|uniref:BRO-N domain-containing protein n=1 Tax=Bacillus sp. ISL-77 TaxID=2819138 RepID=UPI001BECE0EF|nr:BRO family protein [Bacillus sp. ISL-77]MBT2740555.1 hypothetical protein [Bacillus sp. ISL-77]
MTNEIAIFNYGMNEVRTVAKEGNPWFIAKDVSDVLGFSEASAMTRHLDDDEKTTLQIRQSGSNYSSKQVLINESGLYSAILKSRKPEAKAFKRWVTHDVIPSIRKHGAYMTDDVLAKTFDDPNYMLGVLTNLAEERNKRMTAEQTLVLQAPKVEAYDSFLSVEYNDHNCGR